MQIKKEDLTNFISIKIGEFHSKKLSGLSKVNLKKVLKRKNPYLFRAKNITTAEDLIKSILDAYISSQEETLFGSFLEELSIYCSSTVFNGRKSAVEGIDLEFEKDSVKYLVSIKSGPYWGNSSQISKMKTNFKKAKKILGTNSSKQNVICVNGCCYGMDNNPDKGEYLKLCGQDYWYFITNEKEFYKEIIEPLGHESEKKDDEFLKEYSKKINLFTMEILKDFSEDGILDWNKLLEFNSKSSNL